LAAHLAFIAAASCARRSGERFSFLFAFLAANFLASAIRVAAERAADFLAAFNTLTAFAIILFLKFFIFMMLCRRSQLRILAILLKN
jgi:hypothetical protein